MKVIDQMMFRSTLVGVALSVLVSGCASEVPESAPATTTSAATVCTATVTKCDGTCDGNPVSLAGTWEGSGPTSGDACSEGVSACHAALAASCGGEYVLGYATCNSHGCKETRERAEGAEAVARIFDDYWRKNNGLFNFGEPVTDVRQENVAGSTIWTRVHERHRLEYHPENAGTPYEVLLGRLGAELTADRKYEDTPEWKNNTIEIDPVFRGTYAANKLAGLGDGGSLALFGRPLAPAAYETLSDGNSYLVQWFERARFEHHPNEPDPKYKVLLGLLATEAINLGLLQR